MIEAHSVQCPHCWETIEIVVDPSVADQTYTEDCFVCCRPIILSIRIDADGGTTVSARTEDDA